MKRQGTDGTLHGAVTWGAFKKLQQEGVCGGSLCSGPPSPLHSSFLYGIFAKKKMLSRFSVRLILLMSAKIMSCPLISCSVPAVPGRKRQSQGPMEQSVPWLRTGPMMPRDQQKWPADHRCISRQAYRPKFLLGAEETRARPEHPW